MENPQKLAVFAQLLGSGTVGDGSLFRVENRVTNVPKRLLSNGLRLNARAEVDVRI